MGGPGITVQQWPDTQFPNRTHWSLFGFVTTAAEALMSMDIATGFAAPATAQTSYTVPTGRRLRITSMNIVSAGAAAIANVNVRFRTGATLAGNTFIKSEVQAGINGAAVNGGVNLSVPIPDHIEIPGTQQFTLTGQAGTAQLIRCWLTGFLYDVQS